MIQHSILKTYQNVLSLHHKMLAAAEAGNNEIFFELLAQCNKAIVSMNNDGLRLELSSDEVKNKIALVQQLLSQDRQISNILNPSLERYTG